MKSNLSLLALAGFALLIGMQSVPVAAQSNVAQSQPAAAKCPVSVEHAIESTEARTYSWGIAIESYDNARPNYTWAELAKLGCDVKGARG